MSKTDKEAEAMGHNPDSYLLYEYMEKLPFTVRFKVQLHGIRPLYALSAEDRAAAGIILSSHR